MNRVFVNYEGIFWDLIARSQPLSHRHLIDTIEAVLDEHALPWNGAAYARMRHLPFLSAQDRPIEKFERSRLRALDVAGHDQQPWKVNRQMISDVRPELEKGTALILMGLPASDLRDLAPKQDPQLFPDTVRTLTVESRIVPQQNWWVWMLAQEVARVRSTSTTTEFIESQIPFVLRIQTRLAEEWNGASVELGALTSALLYTGVVRGDRQRAKRLIYDVAKRRDSRLQLQLKRDGRVAVSARA